MNQQPGPWASLAGIPTRLFLVRHGEVHPEDRACLYGQMDVRLSDRGYEQSRQTGRALARSPIQAVYSSDLGRARYLGQQIAWHHGIAPQITPHLRERNLGDWQGLPWAEVEATYPEEIRGFQEDRILYRVPGKSENFQDVQFRVRQFIREVVPRHPEQTIVATAHSGPIRVILADAFGMPLHSIFTFEQDYCCLNIVDYYPSGRVRVRTLNSLEHLYELAVKEEFPV